MRTHVKRSLSVVLVLLLFFARVPGTVQVAKAGNPLVKNDKTRHVVCTELSEQAEAYYPSGSSYEDLILLDGKRTTDSTVAIGSPLFNRLHDMMQLSETVAYKQLDEYWKYTDANQSSSTYWFFYDDVLSIGNMSREHVWPKSNGNFFETGAGSDLHHLRPTDATTNSTRNNYTFGDVQNKSISGKKKVTNSAGTTILWYASSYSGNNCAGLVEVMDSVKGDVARILLYVYVTYGSSNTNKNLFTKCDPYGGSGNDGNDGDKIIESLETLLQWNAVDPVDEWEMRRNDLCEDVQGNRNVFIDYPELAWYLFDLESEMPDMQTPSGKAHGGSSQDYRIEAVSSDPSRGTVSVDGQVITASPKEGFRTAGYQVEQGSADVTQSGDLFYVTPHSDCVIKIYFEEKSKVTLTFMANGELLNTQEVYLGESVQLPAQVPSPDDWVFTGWVTEQVEKTDEKPKTIYTASYTPERDTTLYALFTQTEAGGGAGEWTKMTSEEQMAQGLKIIFACRSKSVVAGPQKGDALDYISCSAFSGNLITELPDQTMIYTVGGASGAWTFTSSAGMLSTTGAKKVNLAGSGTTTWTVTIDNSQNTIVNSTNSTCGQLQYNASSPRFNVYTSSQTPIQIYYLTEGDTVYYATEPPHVYELPVITTQPTNLKAAEGQNVSFSITAAGEKMSYQWYQSTDGGATFSAVAEASGKTAEYGFTAAASQSGNRYYCEVSNPAGSVRSETVTLTVVSPPVITKQPKSVKSAVRKMVSFSVVAAGGELSYQWYVSMDGGKSFSKIAEVSGRTSKYCLRVDKASYDGNQYYCVVTNAAGQAVSQTVKLSVVSTSVGIRGLN